MVWTTAADVLDAWIGPDAPTELASIEVWIAKAEREIRRNVPDIQSRLEETDPELTEPDLLATIVDVVTAMVHRVFRNPEGVRQVGVTTGPFSEQKTYGGDQPGSLFLTADELNSLTRTVGETSAAYSIDLTPTTALYPTFYPTTTYPEWWT